MRRFLGIALVAVCGGLACNVNGLSGQCTADSNCQSGAVCEGGYCVSHQCRPACTSAQICDAQTVTCNEVTVPSITVNSPAVNSFAGLSLQASATARAPGGVSGLTFEVQTTGGAILATAAGIPAGQGSSDFTATIPLNGAAIADGPAVFVTRITYQTTQTFSAAPVTFQIDKTPPTISMGTYDGRTAPFVGPGNATGTVTAVITDTASGVDPAEVKLTLVGGDGSTFVGSPATGGVYTFAVPRASLNTTDGFVGPISFKLDAKDLVKNAAPTLSGDPTQVIRVDNAKPSVSIVADTTWYAASAGTLTVSATISDPATESGLVTTGNTRPFLKIGPGSPVFGTQGGGTTWTFSFDPSVQPANTEGPVQFTVTAQDVAGNVQVATDSRNVDNRPPQLSNVQVYLEGTTPTATGVNYPPAPTVPAGYATGRDGTTHFAYSDSVHLKGTITDNGAGLDASTTQFGIDGTIAGAAQSLVCSAGAATCNFDFGPVRLNDLTKTGRIDAGIGNLTLTVLAKDKALLADKVTPAPNSIAANSLAIGVSRLLWSRQFAAATVSGMAVRPNADLIVTTIVSASQDSIFAQFTDNRILTGAAPEDWHAGKDFYAAGIDLGSIEGAPAIGDGGTTARIYVATHGSTGGDFVALDPTSAPTNRRIWACNKDSLGPFHASPAVGPVTKLGTVSNCEAVFAGSDDLNLWGACQNPTTTTACASRQISITDANNVSPTSING